MPRLASIAGLLYRELETVFTIGFLCQTSLLWELIFIPLESTCESDRLECVDTARVAFTLVFAKSCFLEEATYNCLSAVPGSAEATMKPPPGWGLCIQRIPEQSSNRNSEHSARSQSFHLQCSHHTSTLTTFP